MTASSNNPTTFVKEDIRLAVKMSVAIILQFWENQRRWSVCGGPIWIVWEVRDISIAVSFSYFLSVHVLFAFDMSKDPGYSLSYDWQLTCEFQASLPTC